MKVISIYTGHNATVGFFDNGKCHSVLHEEKFSNIKNHFGFPLQALDYYSKQINFNDVDCFSFSSTELLYAFTPNTTSEFYEDLSIGKLRKLYNFLEYKTGFKFLFTGIRNYILRNKVAPKARNIVKEWLLNTYGIEGKKVHFYDHHFLHCITPIYFYGLNQQEEKTLLLSMDGTGDSSFSKIFVYDPVENSLTQIANSRFDSSIGLLYSEMTKFLGMKPLEHEYKVMGLAAYVTNEKYYRHIYKKLSEIVYLNEETLTFESKFNINVASLYFRDNFFCERFDNLAAGLQKFTEDIVLKWIEAAIKKTGIHKISVSGGVFMNVKMNQKIMNLEAVKKAYFQPSAGDESLVIGNACKVFIDNNINMQPINSMYLGHSYSNDEIKEFLEQKGCFEKYQINFYQDIELEIAKLLKQFEIVARFKGACEWGARSLCNRAILGNASDLKTFFEVNDMIKMRDFWMPFAPTILEEWAPKYIKDWDKIKEKSYESSKFMIITFDTTELAKTHIRAAIHQKDYTIRPQIVNKEENIELYKLLKYYEDLTGMGGIMNTSLNIHGYPLVGTLEQAIFTFENSGLNYIALENYLIKKR